MNFRISPRTSREARHGPRTSEPSQTSWRSRRPRGANKLAPPSDGETHVIIRTLAVLAVLIHPACAQEVFDAHVHLHDGETSLRAFEADVAASKLELVGFGGMWF